MKPNPPTKIGRKCHRCGSRRRFVRSNACVECKHKSMNKIADSMADIRNGIYLTTSAADVVEKWKNRKPRPFNPPPMIAGLTLNRLMAGR